MIINMEMRERNLQDNLELLRMGEFKLLLEKELYPVVMPKLCKDITDTIPGSTIVSCDTTNNTLIIKVKKRRDNTNILLADLIKNLVESNINYIYYAYDNCNIDFRYLTEKSQIKNLPLYQLFGIYFLSDLLIRVDL